MPTQATASAVGRTAAAAVRIALTALTLILLPPKAEAAKPLRVAFVGDPQADNLTELDYARRSAYSELRGRSDLDLVIILGDLVNDRPELLAPSKASLDSLGCPWFCVPGNHDRDLGSRPRTLEAFRQTIGYVDTSFVAGNVRFILMNNVRESKGGYEAGFTERQKTWLASVTASEDRDVRHTVLATHIPIPQCRPEALDSLRVILKDCPGLLLVSGHTHSVKRHSVRVSDDRTVESLTAGSVCGTWWRGEKDADGIPLALQNCGAPRGWFQVDFVTAAYSMTYIPFGREKKGHSLTLKEDGKLVLNVFGGSSEAVVRMKVAGRWLEALPYGAPAPEVQKIIEAQSAVTREARKAHPELFIPMRRTVSPHCWYVQIPGQESESRTRETGAETVRSGQQPLRKKLRVLVDYSDPAMRLRKREVVGN